MGEFFILGELGVGIRNEESGVGGWLLRCGRGCSVWARVFGVGAGVFGVGAGVFGVGAGVFGVGCGAKRKSQRSAHPGEQCSPLLYNRKGWVCFCAGLAFCLQGPAWQARQRCGGGFSGLRVRRGRGCSVCAAGRNARASVRQTRASNARPYYIIGKVEGVFMQAQSLACRGLHCRPANGAGWIWGLQVRRGRGVQCRLRGETQEPAFGKPGRSQAPPLRWNCERAIKISRILLRFMVGVGLCSTRGALRQHKALAGEQCSPLR